MVDSFTEKNKSTILMDGTFITFSSSQAIKSDTREPMNVCVHYLPS